MAWLDRSNTRWRRGFTLLEVIVTVAILGTVIVLSTYGLSSMQKSFASQQGDREITNSLSLAARRARTGMHNSAWGVYIPYDDVTRTSTTITVFRGNSYATRTATDDVISTINDSAIFLNVDFSGDAANTGNDHEIVFAALTGSTTQYGSVGIEWLGEQRTITIDPDGFAIRSPL